MAVLVAFLLVLAFVVAVVARRRPSISTPPLVHHDVKPLVPLAVDHEGANGSTATPPEPTMGDIEPFPDFDWRATPPLQLRPFKPTYNITMGVFIVQES